MNEPSVQDLLTRVRALEAQLETLNVTPYPENLGGYAAWGTHLLSDSVSNKTYSLLTTARGQFGADFPRTNIRDSGRISQSGRVALIDTVALWGEDDEVDALAPHLAFTWSFLSTSCDIAPLAAMTPCAIDSEHVRRWRWRFKDPENKTSLFPAAQGGLWRIPSNATVAIEAVVGEGAPQLERGVNLQVILSGYLVSIVEIG